MTSQSTAEIKDHAVVSFVQRLKDDDDRGTLALLRGALADSNERQIRAWRVLARFGGIPDHDPHKAEVVRTVAGLLAMKGLYHGSGGQSFGSACQKLLGDDERKSLSKPEQPGPVSRRVEHLLAANQSEICDRVRQLGRRLDGVKTELDFNRLYSDIFSWPNNARARWAADFWGVTEDVEPTTAKETA